MSNSKSCQVVFVTQTGLNSTSMLLPCIYKGFPIAESNNTSGENHSVVLRTL